MFVALGWRVRRAPAGQVRTRAVRQLVVFVLVISAAVGCLQWDAWPFSPYHILVGRANIDKPNYMPDFYGVDAGGREWKLDPITFAPVYELTLQVWFNDHFGKLGEADRDRVLAFLLARAEATRARLAAGRTAGDERWLGRVLAAPHFWIPGRALAVPDTPYAGLRVYEVRRVPRAMLTDRASAQRRLLGEYRAR
jgi:hypothetical protein